MGVIGQRINMGFYGKRQRSPAKNDQYLKPHEPSSLNYTTTSLSCLGISSFKLFIKNLLNNDIDVPNDTFHQ